MTAQDVTGWEPLTPSRSAEIRERWGLTGTRTRSHRATTAPVTAPARVQRASAADAVCPEHGVNWSCGCDGCEAALNAPADPPPAAPSQIGLNAGPETAA